MLHDLLAVESDKLEFKFGNLGRKVLPRKTRDLFYRLGKFLHIVRHGNSLSLADLYCTSLEAGLRPPSQTFPALGRRLSVLGTTPRFALDSIEAQTPGSYNHGLQVLEVRPCWCLSSRTFLYL